MADNENSAEVLAKEVPHLARACAQAREEGRDPDPAQVLALATALAVPRLDRIIDGVGALIHDTENEEIINRWGGFS
jgi:hypothetical protein